MRAALALLASLVSAAAPASQFVATVTDDAGRPVADAVVYLSSGTAAGAPTTMIRPTTIEVDQVDKEFVPRVSVVQTGTAIEFPNSDNIRHQVYSFSPAKTFTLKLYSGRPSAPVIFDQPGMVVLGCNIHDHMVAWVLAVDTPWFARTDTQGRASIGELPAGTYSLSVWHSGLRAPIVSGAVEVNGSGTFEKKLRLDSSRTAHSHDGSGH